MWTLWKKWATVAEYEARMKEIVAYAKKEKTKGNGHKITVGHSQRFWKQKVHERGCHQSRILTWWHALSYKLKQP